MAQPFFQSAFTAGELSPSLYAHVDFSKFAIGAATMRNFFVSYRGGAFSRAGTLFVGYSKQTVNNIATGYIHFPSNPTNGQGIILNGVAFTFVTSGATPSNFQFNIGANAGGTISLAVLTLNTSATYLANTLLNGATYSDSGGSTEDDLIVTWNSPGPAGNSYRLSADAPATVSGPTLTGGGSTPPRLVRFQFNLNQGLVLEFGQQYMRVISDGAFVTEDGSAISGATKASPCTITQASHGFTTGKWVYISEVEGMTELNGRTFVITVLTSSTYTLQDVFGNNIDSSSYGTYTGGGVGAAIYELETPYAAEDLKFLKFAQSADVMSLCLRNQQTGTEYASYELSRLANNDWTLEELDTSAGIAAPENLAGTATDTTMTDPTDYQYVVTAVDKTTGRESVASNIADVDDSVDISSVAGSINLVWDPVPNADYYNIYKAPPAYNSTVPAGSQFGYAGQVFGVTFVDSNIVQDMLQVPPYHRNPFARGQALSVDITDPGGSLTGPIGFIITTADGTGAAGYGILVGGEMVAWVFTDFGQNYADGDTIAFFDAASTKATGDIDFGVTNPSNGDTITLNGRVFTFVTAGGWPTVQTNYQINIGGNLGGTLFFLEQALTSGATYLADSLLNVADYTTTASALEIEYKTPGTAGNSYTLAASAATPSGATLSGGTGGDLPEGTLIVGPETGTYPSVVNYVQQRRVYANTANQQDTYWMSQPGDFSNFDIRIPPIDSDAITGTPWSVQVDGIQFMLPLLGGMVMLTGETAYMVMGQGGSPQNPAPITPTSQQALPQAFNGCHFHVGPQLIDYDIYYLQSKGSVIRSLSYNYWVNVLTGIDITFLSSHLFDGFQVESLTWCEEPYKIMWAVRDDGVLLSLTTLKAQEVMAWARHDTQGLFSSSVSITEPPVDALYLCVQRFFGDDQPFIIERMDDRLWSNVEEAWCVDCALALPQPEPNATMSLSSAYGLGQPVDFDDLDGGENYSDQTTVTVKDLDGVGSGCTVAVEITDGVITDLTFTGGANYRRPILQAVDPQNKGRGFSAIVVLSNLATLTTDTAVIAIGDVGNIVRAGGGVIEITDYLTATEFEVQIVSPVTQVIPNTGGRVPPFDPGEWTCTNPITTVTGLYHLIGAEVTGLADGSVIPPQTVSAAGSITLEDGASAIVVGLAYQAQIQSLYLEGATPTVQGRRKNVGAVTARVQSSGNFQIGSNQPDGAALSPPRVEVAWRSMADASVNQPGLTHPAYGNGAAILDSSYVRPVPLFTGDVRIPIGGGYEKAGQAAVQQNEPLPVQVLGFMRESDNGDEPEDDSNVRQRGR